MKIIIMRHAKVQIENRSIYANEFNEMIEEYDHAPIEEQMDNEDELKKVADEANYFLSSGLRRSLDSLALLGKKADDIDEIFAEAELPSGRRKWIKLPLFIWVFIFRLFWLLGYSGEGRSYRESQEDALKATLKLEALAKEHGTVFLLGHGLKNRLIAQALKRRGWHETQKMSLKNWGYGVYETL